MFPSFINTPYITHKTQNLLAKFKTSHQMKGVPTPPQPLFFIISWYTPLLRVRGKKQKDSSGCADNVVMFIRPVTSYLELTSMILHVFGLWYYH